jgi:hypothetical protein
VDGHEKPETVNYRNKYMQHYLMCERYMYRWIQIPEEESNALEKQGAVASNSAYRYKNFEGQNTVEYHVDSSSIFQGKADKETRFSGFLSVWIENDKPLIIFGHDKCIFKQYHMTKSAWVAPDGTMALVPRDDGEGVMISAFQSREFGFEMQICKKELKKINEKRKREKYVDESAAMAKRETTEKRELRSSPFTIEFDYRANNEGY